MKKLIGISISFALLLFTLWVMDVWQDKVVLHQNLIRLHVVANSNSEEDQFVKLQVRDAVIAYLQHLTADIANKEQAMEIIIDQLPSIQQIANEKLAELGESDRTVVSLNSESFLTREYETFSLPAGVYDSLRIQIGDGEGRNWWCVVFPSLCLPATSEGFCDTAVSSGFSVKLGNTLTNKRNFRFIVLDCIGRMENLFY